MKQHQEEFDLEWYFAQFSFPSKYGDAISVLSARHLLEDFSKYVTPERNQPGHTSPPEYWLGRKNAIDEIEANTRKVLGDE